MAIAQIVLSLTRFPGIGQVLFTRDGVPFDVPLPPNDELSPFGEPVAYEDFEILLVERPSSTPTTTTAPMTGPRYTEALPRMTMRNTMSVIAMPMLPGTMTPPK